MNRRKASTALWEALADEALTMTDSEIFADFRERGLDPKGEAEKTKKALISSFKKVQRRIAERELSGAVQRKVSHEYSVPATPQERIGLLAHLLSTHPRARTLTLQFRNLEELTDREVISILEDLFKLGFTPKNGE